MTWRSFPPTISSVGARTCGNTVPARSGRPPRDTTGAKISHREPSGVGILGEPLGRGDKPMREQGDVEAQFAREQIELFLLGGQEVDQQGREPRLAQHVGDMPVARTVPATAATVGKQHDGSGLLWETKGAFERHVTDGGCGPTGSR